MFTCEQPLQMYSRSLQREPLQKFDHGSATGRGVIGRVECLTPHIIGHFGDKSFQAAICTGLDIQAYNNQDEVHKKTSPTQANRSQLRQTLV